MVQKYTVIHGCRTLTLNGLIIRFTGKNSYVLEYLQSGRKIEYDKTTEGLNYPLFFVGIIGSGKGAKL